MPAFPFMIPQQFQLLFAPDSTMSPRGRKARGNEVLP